MTDSRHEPPLPEDDEIPLQSTVASATTGLILAVAFGLLAVGVPWFWVVFPVGFAGLLPVVLKLTQHYESHQSPRQPPGSESTTTAETDALETLRNRYARREIDEAEFERRLDALLETESVERAVDYANRETAHE